ncbi:hypothetical protein phiLdb_00046 [Lactobacillus phage phiLdb]|uniref:Uncharacterized protein n=1 Tax=Lactobacillus phage phiLdb TaxID=1399942 RepID=U3PCV1_9CAUD|nr:hypothetical protein phiLdb_00046 [Lactobacillus phage phiLdb]AGW43723.1 hypothetical protein phiLdb_00046 [Lactobacillus phage phiLdb]
MMNYKRMWLSLKKIIDEEKDVLSEDLKKASTSLLVDQLEAQYDEADYIAGEMKALEVREILLQEKEKCEAKNESH